MLAASVQRLEQTLDPSASVLDVGGWARPLARADWVVDRMPWESRGMLGRDGGGAERFSADTWVVRDICDRVPLPFADGQFDFVVCSHTLEDVRDPVWLCSELVRVGRAGYVETPSRLEEQSYGVQGPWVGWGHHHWLVDPVGGGLEFVFKHHVMHGRASDHFPAGFHEGLSAEERVVALWWTGSFAFRERPISGAEELDAYLADFVSTELRRRGRSRPRRRRRLPLPGRR